MSVSVDIPTVVNAVAYFQRIVGPWSASKHAVATVLGIPRQDKAAMRALADVLDSAVFAKQLRHGFKAGETPRDGTAGDVFVWDRRRFTLPRNHPAPSPAQISNIDQCVLNYALLATRKLTPKQKIVAARLLGNYDDRDVDKRPLYKRWKKTDRGTRMAASYLAAQLGCTRETARRSLDALVKSGLFRENRGFAANGRSRVTEYQPVSDAPEIAYKAKYAQLLKPACGFPKALLLEPSFIKRPRKLLTLGVMLMDFHHAGLSARSLAGRAEVLGSTAPSARAEIRQDLKELVAEGWVTKTAHKVGKGVEVYTIGPKYNAVMG